MRVSLVMLALGLCVLSGCGGGGSKTSGNLRFVQASPDAPLVAVFNERTQVGGTLSYGDSTGYFSFPSGAHLRVYPASGAQTALFQATPSITSSGNQTLVLTGAIANPTSILLTDGGTTAATGQVEVRVVNAARNFATPPDVYIVAAGSGIAGSPTVSGLAFNASAGYDAVPSGTYEVFVTTAGTKNALLDTGPINLSSGNQTIILLDRTSGGFTFTLLTDQ